MKAAQVIENEESILVDETGKQLTQADIKPIAKAVPQPTGIDGLIAMAINKDLDMDKLDRLLAIKEREESKTEYAAFVVAISQFQAHCPTVKKTGTVTDKNGRQIYTYPKFDSIMKTIQPHMEKNGLSVRFNSDISDGKVKVHCMVSHAGGHTDDSYFACPIEASMAGGANASQRTASANSFAKRYAIMNALNIAGSDYDDDDAQILGAEPEAIPEDATEEQLATIQDFKDAGSIPDVTQAWIDKQSPLTERAAAGLLKKLNEAKS